MYGIDSWGASCALLCGWGVSWTNTRVEGGTMALLLCWGFWLVSIVGLRILEKESCLDRIFRRNMFICGPLTRQLVRFSS